jgi:hypothetical protein
MLKPQSIRKGIDVFFNNKLVSKQEILDFSVTWTAIQETLFRKTLQQGGEMNIQGIKIKVIPQDPIVNSQGEKDPGIIIFPGSDVRF